MTAADVIGKYLIAEQDVPLYFLPGAAPIGMVKKGLVIGPVFSWIEDKGKLYWAFDYTIPGQAPSSYYAEHKPSYWKLSATGAGEPGGASGVTISPAINIPTWAYWAGAGVLAVLLLRK